MERKQLGRMVVKRADEGLVAAVFSTFDVEDLDGDVTLPGAIKGGTEVVISAYGHGSWDGLLPVGKGTIRTTTREAILDGAFVLDTEGGRETFAVVKQLGPLQEWSYSLHNVAYRFEQRDGHEVRVLESMDVKEVSPTLRGSGIDTRTLSTKSRRDLETVDVEREYLRYVSQRWSQ